MLFGIYFVMQIYYMLVEIFIKISQIVQVSSGETRVGHFKRVKKKKNSGKNAKIFCFQKWHI